MGKSEGYPPSQVIATSPSSVLIRARSLIAVAGLVAVVTVNTVGPSAPVSTVSAAPAETALIVIGGVVLGIAVAFALLACIAVVVRATVLRRSLTRRRARPESLPSRQRRFTLIALAAIAIPLVAIAVLLLSSQVPVLVAAAEQTVAEISSQETSATALNVLLLAAGLATTIFLVLAFGRSRLGRRFGRATRRPRAFLNIRRRRAGVAFDRVTEPALRRWRGVRRRYRVVMALLATAAISVVAVVSVLGSSIAVNTTLDAPDGNPGDGVCDASLTGQENRCTLRAAIMEANAHPAADTITIPSGTYELAIPTLNDDRPDSGDFDITTSMTIRGAGMDATIIDGGYPPDGSPAEQLGMDRLFEVHPPAANVKFIDLTLREGFSSEEGGAIQSWSPGLVRLEQVHVFKNLASKTGGGVNLSEPADYPWLMPPVPMPPAGRIEIFGSRLTGNSSGGGGAAINNAGSGTILIENTFVEDNPGLMIPDPEFVNDPLDPYDVAELIPAPGVFEPDSSPIDNQAEFDRVGTIHIVGSTVRNNFAHHDGAGVTNSGHGNLIIEGSTFNGNRTDADGGAIYSKGGTLSISGSTVSDNQAHSGGGIYSAGESNAIGLRSRVTISGTTISGNAAEQVAGNIAEADGGGMVLDGDAHVVLTDLTIAENKAGDAGGGFTAEGRLSLVATRLTIRANETTGEGGGAYIDTERPVVIRDSLVSGNKAGVPEPPMPGDVPPIGCPGCPTWETSGNVAGGGGLYTEGGPITIRGTTIENNVATEEGGGITIDNFGAFLLADSTIKGNRAGHDGGGIENSGMRTTFDHILVEGNSATIDGGGIYNSSSDQFLVIDSTIQKNVATNGGGFGNAPDADLIIRQTSIIGNTARMPGLDDAGLRLDGGEGGGFWSKADGDALIENTTISGNKAAISGGGLFHDADGELKLSNVTVWGNAALAGGGIGVAESDFVPEVPPKANQSVILRNTIVGGSTSGGSCDWYLTSEGGNVSGGSVPAVPMPGLISSDSPPVPPIGPCFFQPAPGTDSSILEVLRDRFGDAELDALADNGGPTLTNALRYGSFAIDQGMSPCPATDQRGITRPQNDKCDAGAYEFVGPPPPEDNEDPDTEYLSGPIQDTLETNAFTFTGSDNLTPVDELQFECRLYELELAEQPEPLAPWDPIPPELMWVNCVSPWSVPIIGEDPWIFEVRAIDRAGRMDESPDIHHINADLSAPNTIIEEKPGQSYPGEPYPISNSRAATFSFSAVDNTTPAQFAEYECRIDTRDPELWVECFNPFMVSNLTTGLHTFEVRAMDANENIDPTPARYTWLVGQPASCDLANITLTPSADAWVDQVNLIENYVFSNELTVRSGAVGDPLASPPEPVRGENARALVRFALQTDAPLGCELESATLRLYAESNTEGREIAVTPLTGTFKESTVTWSNQPGASGIPSRAPSREHAGYMEWDVTAHVLEMLEAGISHGWRVHDAVETDPEGGDQAFASREMLNDPPEYFTPELVLVYSADATPPPPPPQMPAGTRPPRSSAVRSCAITRCSPTTSTAPSGKDSRSARRTSLSTSTATPSRVRITSSAT